MMMQVRKSGAFGPDKFRSVLESTATLRLSRPPDIQSKWDKELKRFSSSPVPQGTSLKRGANPIFLLDRGVIFQYEECI